jgi:hypothetical protein
MRCPGATGDDRRQRHRDRERIPGAVLAQVQSVLARARVKPTTTTIIFTDQNGPKGGMAIRCAVTAAVPRQATVRIAPLAATAPLAFAKAMKALERSLSGVPDQRRALSRRPKKYYLAKRMLESS